MIEPSIGELVLVRPSAPDHRVQRHPEMFGQFLSIDWAECVWSDWMHRRFCDGSILWKSIPAEAPKKSKNKEE